MKKRIAIIGSGISAASFYYFLDKERYDVEIFEKARGFGGRMSYKRSDNAAFDHGANCFGAINSEEFTLFTDKMIERKVVQQWSGNFMVYDSNNGRIQDQENKERLVSYPRSNSLIKEMFDGINQEQVHFSKKASKIQNGKQLEIIFEDDSKASNFDYVITSAPAPQTKDLIPKNCSFYDQVKEVEYDATYALMLEYEADEVEIDKLDFSHIAVKHDIITRIAHENSKPGRDLKNHCILIHSSNKYANENLDTDHQKIQEDMIRPFIEITGVNQRPLSAKIHRWLYSNPKNNPHIQELFDHDLKIGAIGDYMHRPRLEFAFESGLKMAKLLNSF